jgi:hypothetical protein
MERYKSLHFLRNRYLKLLTASRNSIVLSIALFAILVIAPNALAANWYVDNVASGSNNGTSWTNAWESFGDISWVSISAGDTVYISGGTSSKTYGETLTIGASGSDNSNRIYIRTGAKAPSPSGHDGVVIIDGATNGISSANRSYVTIDGENSGSQNLRIINTTSNAVNCSTCIGMKFLYINIVGTGTGDDNSFAFRIITHDSDTEVAYCDVDTPYANGIRFGGGTAYSYGSGGKLHDCLIYGMGDDALAGSFMGADIYNNVIGPWSVTGAPGHPDGAQVNGNYVRYWNNVFQDYGNHFNGSNALIFFEMDLPKDMGNYQIFNNIFLVGGGRYISGRWQAIVLKNNSIDTLVMSNVLIANNTFVDVGARAIWFSNDGKPNTTLQNVEIKNNIFHNTNTTGSGTAAIFIESFNGDSTDVVIDRNAFYETYGGDGRGDGKDGVHFEGTAYVSPSAWDTFAGTTNYACQTSFVTYTEGAANNGDYHLQSSDTCALDVLDSTGNGMSSYFTFDKDDKLRPQNSLWNIGAYEYTSGDNISPAPPFLNPPE